MTDTTDRAIVLLPQWLEKVMVRNKTQMSKVLDYDWMTQYSSVDDIASLVNLQRLEPLASMVQPCYKHLVDAWVRSRPEAKEEIDRVIVTASTSSDYDDSNLEDLDGEPVDQYWKMLDIDKSILGIVVYPGILTALADPNTKLTFLRQIVELFYGYLPMHEVARKKVFANYLLALKDAKE